MKKHLLRPLQTEFPMEVGTRVSVLRRKAKADRLDIPEDVMSFIANQFTTSRYDLEGAVMRIMAYASIVNKDISVELAAQAFNIDISSVSASVPMPRTEGLSEVTPSYQEADMRHRLVAFRRRLTSWYERNTLTGIAEGIILSTLSTLAMAATCLFMDVVLKYIGLLTLSVPWIWWSIIGLNALSVCVPVDVFRAHTAHFNQSAHARASVVTHGALELIIVSLFLVFLFRLQNVDIQVMQALGLLNP